MRYTPAQIRKVIVGAVGFVLTIVAALLAVGDVIPDAALPYINAFVAVAGSYGIFKAPNAPASEPDHLA